MGYINPAELFAGNFRPKVQAMLPIVPALVQRERQKENQKLVGEKWQTEKPGLEASARLHNAQAANQEWANKIKNQFAGGEGGMPFGLTGLPVNDIQKALMYDALGITMPKEEPLKSVYDAGKGAWVYGRPKEGDIVKPEAEQYAKIDYWIKGPQGWRQTSEQVPKDAYNNRMKQIEAAGGRLDEPPEIARQKKIDEFRALSEERVNHIVKTLKARGIDTSKFNQQQRFWADTIERRARERGELIINSDKLTFEQQEEKLNQLQDTVESEYQRIANGIPPTILTPKQPMPVGQPKQVQPQTTVMPKRLPGETVEQYIARVGNR